MLCGSYILLSSSLFGSSYSRHLEGQLISVGNKTKQGGTTVELDSYTGVPFVIGLWRGCDR